MAAAIADVHSRAVEVEVVAVRVAGVYAEVPVASVEVERTIEVGCIAEGAILPVEQNVAHVEIAVAPVGPIQVVDSIYTHKVVEVYLVCCLILVVGQIQLISHFVGQEQSLLTSLLITHSV